jgi:hypothetical protein
MENFQLNEIPIGYKLPIFLSNTNCLGKIEFEGRYYDLYNLKFGLFEKIYIDDLLTGVIQFFLMDDVIVRFLVVFDEFDFNEVSARIIHNYPNAQLLENNERKIIFRSGDLYIEALKEYKSGYEIYVSSLSLFYRV